MTEYWTETGEMFGYPECCIKEFVIRLDHNDKNPSDFICVKRIPSRVSEGTGFIPCSYCSWKILTKRCNLEDLIKNRKYELPFPQDGMK